MRKLFGGIVLCLLLSSCSVFESRSPYIVEYDSFPRKIPVPVKTEALCKRFHQDALGNFITVTKADGQEFRGYVTDNQSFLYEVMLPRLNRHRSQLREMSPTEMINTLTLFGHETYRTYFGTSYFSWGGDILDLDDPQESGPNYDRRFGFDCSGFSSMPYTVAVIMGLLDPKDDSAVFSTQGFRHYAGKNGIRDKGGRGGTSNRFRVDTADMKSLGRVIFTVPKNGRARERDLAKLQPGDLVLLPQGHVGIVVDLGGDFYYLEAGGWVCPPNGGLPFRIAPALEIFAKKGEMEIRRCLPDQAR